MIHFDRISTAHARAFLACMVGNPKWDTTDGMSSIDEIVGEGVPFIVSENGTQLAVFVLEKNVYANGVELMIRVAKQMTSAGDVTSRILPEVERRFGDGCDFVTIRTRRAGLVSKLSKNGYTEAAKIMRKKLK